MISYELSPKYLLGFSKLEDICTIDACIFCGSFFMPYFPTFYLFLLVCMHNFSDFLCSSELSFTVFPVSENLRSSDPPIHIWSTYLASGCYVQYSYFRVAWIEGWTGFFMSIIISLLLKSFFSWVWSSIITAPWLRKKFSLCSFYWIVQTQVINL